MLNIPGSLVSGDPGTGGSGFTNGGKMIIFSHSSGSVMNDYNKQ